MLTFKSKALLGILCVSTVIAFLAGSITWRMSRDSAEATIVAMAVEESRQLLSQEIYRPQGPQAMLQAQAAARILTATLFDVVEIYNAKGELLAQAMTAIGRTLEKDLAPRGLPSYSQSYFESQRPPLKRWVLRVYVPLLTQGPAINAYVEGVRLVPQWQLEQVRADAFKIAWAVALAVLLCGVALYPLVLNLFAFQQRKAKEVLVSHLGMMESLGRAIARKDADSSAHNYRVAWVSAALAQEVGLHGSRMQALIVGSFLHDVGKIGIADAILNKPERLTESEMAIMRTHVEIGEDIVAGEGWLNGGQSVVAFHHEKWDGSGYPRGLSGDDIPQVARIFAIADAFDTLCSKRPYKEAMTLDEVMQLMEADAGRHFDPHLFKVFSGLAGSLFQTLSQASENEMRAKLEVMVHKHFAL